MITQYKSWHDDLMQRIVAGQTFDEMAGELNMTAAYLKVVAGSTLFQAKLKEIRNEHYKAIGERLESFSHEALDKIVEKMRNAKQDAIQLAAAREILDRSGYVKVDKSLSVVADAEAIIRELGRLKNEHPERIIDGEDDDAGVEQPMADDTDGAGVDAGRDGSRTSD